MWDWLKKVGKVALAASPYIAAPFTGGASLMLAPAVNMAEKKWAQHDAEANIAKGIAPSSFDKYLGMAGDIASIAAPTGALGALGKVASTGGKVGGLVGGIGKAATIANAGLGVTGILANAARSNGSPEGMNTTQTNSTPGGNRLAGGTGSRLFTGQNSIQTLSPNSMPFPQQGKSLDPNVMPQGGYSYEQNPLNQIDQSSPNLALAMNQGRAEALANLKRQGSIFAPRNGSYGY